MKFLIAALLVGVSFSVSAAESCSECYNMPPSYLPPSIPVVPVVVTVVQPTVTPQVHQSIQSSQISATNTIYRGTTMAQIFNTSAAAGQPKPSAPACK